MKGKLKTASIVISILAIGAVLYHFVFYSKSTDVNSTTYTIDSLSNFLSENDNIVGKEEAPLTIVEFSDYNCNACQYSHENWKKIKLNENYIQTGKVKYILKDVPSNEKAIEASLVAMIAGEQNKYWEMHSLLFVRKKEWINEPKGYDLFKKYAEELDLDLNKFENSLENRNKYYKKRLKNSREQYKKLKIAGTPMIIIGDTQINGAPDYKILEEVIEKELTKN
ncbi:DsbA family protein [Caldalkalibacillus mannanilyticus]|uniref:DsbA family protein n=1 Tax=Caldalkalibacillus mannanilyticus TaxID=1418 RepID=UPI000469A870|nr:thioredoxin domain-containing protein [Caldalkalibacillus mannanilyticus]